MSDDDRREPESDGIPSEIKLQMERMKGRWGPQSRLSDPALQAAAAAFRAPIASVPPQQDLSIGMGNAKEHVEATELPQPITEDEVPRVEVNLGDDMPRELPEGRRSAPTVETKIPTIADLAFEAPVIREKETPPAEPAKTITGTLQLPKPASDALNATTTPRPEEEKKPGNKRAIIGLAIVMVGAAIALVVARMPGEQLDGASAGIAEHDDEHRDGAEREGNGAKHERDDRAERAEDRADDRTERDERAERGAERQTAATTQAERHARRSVS